MSDRPADMASARQAGLGLADEVRALIEDVNRSAPDVDSLEAARGHVAAARAALESPDRRRWYEVPLDEIDEDLTIRLREEAGDHSLFRGGRNPLAPPLRVSAGVDSDGEPVVVGEVRLERSREGPPERVHGGMVAGIFDDVLSGAPGLVDAGPVVTGRLSVRYRRPTPLDVELRFEARVVRHSGRRLVARARCLAPTADGGTEVTAEAEALFVGIPRRSQEGTSEPAAGG
jgi:acyl-coenzyme A thioesterase PaaI-like protein